MRRLGIGRQSGNPIEGFDALIAATALALASPRAALLASQRLRMDVIDPWGGGVKRARVYPHRSSANRRGLATLTGANIEKEKLSF